MRYYRPHYLALIFAMALKSHATTLYRCESTEGHLTFSQHGCPIDQRQSQQRAYNPPPGSGKPVPLARPPQRSKVGATGKASAPLTVVGERQDGCGNLLGDAERRTAIIQGRIRTGMTRSDVESAFGKPDRIAQNDSRVRYIYEVRPGKARRTISFDEFGCVQGPPAKRR